MHLWENSPASSPHRNLRSTLSQSIRRHAKETWSHDLETRTNTDGYIDWEKKQFDSDSGLGLRGSCCTWPVDDPHPWMVAVTGGSCYPSRGRKSTGRVGNPRVGWRKSMRKRDRELLRGTIIYLLILRLISRWKIHEWGRPDPWMGEGRKKHKIRNTKIKNENNMYFHLTNKQKTNT